jgi:hypothetical protein
MRSGNRSGDDQPREVSVRPAGFDGDIVTAAAGRRWPAWTAAVVAVGVALAVGLGVGFQWGLSRWPSPPSPAGSSPAWVSVAVNGTGARCSVQAGTSLQLGIEVVNRLGTPVTVEAVRFDLPIGGLRMTAASWGGCGQLDPAATAGTLVLAPEAMAWVSATFDVLDPCPAPYPVRFLLRYRTDAETVEANVGGFVDLGDVPYSGCPASPS